MQYNLMRKGWEYLLDMIYPRECCACLAAAEPIGGWRYLCRSCKGQIHWIEEPFCTQCGGMFDGSIEGKVCGQCELLKPVFDQGRSFIRFKGPGRIMIHTLKYNLGKHILPDISRLMTQRPDILKFIQGGILVPVPLHWKKQYKRGFNQSTLITNELRKLSISVKIAQILKRVHPTLPQTHLKRQERLENVKNAFAIIPKTALDSSLRYILVDDVYTTGATLKTCAKLLKQHGAKRVDVVTLCHG